MSNGWFAESDEPRLGAMLSDGPLTKTRSGLLEFKNGVALRLNQAILRVPQRPGRHLRCQISICVVATTEHKKEA